MVVQGALIPDHTSHHSKPWHDGGRYHCLGSGTLYELQALGTQAKFHAPVAQVELEHKISNLGAAGSSPARGTKQK